MQELPSAPFASTPLQILHQGNTGLLLRAHAAHLEMFANYEEALQAVTRSTANCDSKQLKKHQRVLQTADAYRILAIIWKESDFITTEALSDAGMCRQYNGCDLTAHRLAVDLAEGAQEVAKLNSRVRNIGMAAATHQLLDRDSIHNTKVVLKGTLQLHQLMSEVSERHLKALAKFAPFPVSVMPAVASGR